jgi:iron(III) transport system substrate-binding protein
MRNRTFQKNISILMVVVGCSYGTITNGQTNVEALKQKEINLYSTRHFPTDETLYSEFTKKTGIKINRIEATESELSERLKGNDLRSPADVIMLVDASRLWKIEHEGFFKRIHSQYLEERIPENLRSKKDTYGSTWFGVTTRARMIVYNKSKVKPTDVDTYEKLADPINKGMVCTRSGTHPYMLSLMGSRIELQGERATEDWAKGIVRNMARSPSGGDTDQIKAVANGECGVTLTNSYYLARLMKSSKPEDQKVISNIGYIWPNQTTTGTHINIIGAGVAKNAPHPKESIEFMEYLASDEAQKYFANRNHEWAVVKTVEVENDVLKKLGNFIVENIPMDAFAKHQKTSQEILEKVGYH